MRTKNEIHFGNHLWLCGLLLTVGILLGGCAAKAPVREPVVSRPTVQKETATGSLLADARRALQAGRFDTAEVTLERALRVDSRNAGLWHEMAQVKYGQKHYGQTVQFCLKANNLAGRNSALIKQNWLLMAKAYDAMGERGKATEARMKAEAIH